MITKPIRKRLDQGQLTAFIDEGFTWISTARNENPARILFHSAYDVTVEYPEAPEHPLTIGYASIRAIHKPEEEESIP